MERTASKELIGQQKNNGNDSSKNGNPTPYQKKDGNWYCNRGKSLQRLLIFVSSEDLVKMKDDGRPLSTIGREAIKDWLEKNGR